MKYIVFTLISLMLSVSYAKPKVKVAVIDTGFTNSFATERTKKMLCKEGHMDFTLNSPTLGYDAAGHGTYVANLVAENIKHDNFCIVVYKVYDPITGYKILDALEYLAKTKVRAMNLSMYQTRYSVKLETAIARLNKQGIKMFVASGNSGKNLNLYCNTYPTCVKGNYKNLYSVGAWDRNEMPTNYTNYGEKVAVYEWGDIPGGGEGTSFASPRALARFVDELENERN